MCGGMGGGGVLLLFNDDDGDGDDCCICCCCCCCLMMEGLRVVLRCCWCCCWLDILILSVTSRASSDLLVRPKVACCCVCSLDDFFVFVCVGDVFCLTFGDDDIFSIRFDVWNGRVQSLPVPEM